jgi:hypothetical protein
VKLIGRAIQLLVGLAVLIGLVGGAGWVVYTGITKAPAVVAAVVTGIAALFGLFFQRYLEWQREDARQRRERMTPIYERLVTTFYKAGGEGVPEHEQVAFFEDLAQRLLLWGSPPILSAFAAWKRSAVQANEGDGHATTTLFTFEQLLLAMRADMGQSNDGLRAGDLLRVIVNDIDDHLDTETA